MTRPTAIHPGEHLAEELSALGMSAAELARQLGVPTNRITEILNGRRAITGDSALRLAHFFGTSAEFWLNLQSLYEIRVAEQRSGKSIRALPTLKHIEQAHALRSARATQPFSH
jgi:antitoxin HigA-1